jgi:hypothetical protein
LAESPKNENLLYAGTDDGLIHVSDNNGKTWTKTEKFASVPDQTFIQNIIGSQHDENVAYAIFNNHRNGDFKPYIMKTTDKGKTWTDISANLPERGSAHCIAEDHVNANLLFVGTDFGLYFSLNGGTAWTALNGGLPTISVRDIAIQQRENDLVLATFGRGFYVLDDYSLLQKIKAEDLNEKAKIFPVKDALVYKEATPLGHKGKSNQGESYYTADNPPVGAVITYWIKEESKTIKEKRKESEKEKIKNNQPVYYPTLDSIRMEDNEEAAYLMMVISDNKGNVVRKLKQSFKKGMHRIHWNGRMDVTSPISFYTPNPDNPYEGYDQGPLALPGKYQAHLVKVEKGMTEVMTEKINFELISMNNSTLPTDKKALETFNQDLAEFRRVVLATSEYSGQIKERIKYIKAASLRASVSTGEVTTEVYALEILRQNIDLALNGNRSLSRREFENVPGLLERVEGMVDNLWSTSAQQTGTYVEKLKETKQVFKKIYADVKLLKQKLELLEKRLENMKAPYTPGRFPEYDEQ